MNIKALDTIWIFQHEVSMDSWFLPALSQTAKHPLFGPHDR